MTRILLMTAAATALTATAATAYTGVSPSLLASARNVAEEVGLDVDFTRLTDEQVIEIYAAGQGNDAGEQLQLVRAAVEGTGALDDVTARRVILVDPDETGLMPMGENSVVTSVQNWLNGQGYEVDVSTLSDNQVAELYFLAFSNPDMGQPSGAEIDAILGS